MMIRWENIRTSNFKQWGSIYVSSNLGGPDLVRKKKIQVECIYVHYKKIKKASMVTDLVKKGEISNVHKLQTF